MNCVGVYIPEEDEPKPYEEDYIFNDMVKHGQAKRIPLDEITLRFHRSVQSVLDVEVGPELEMPDEPLAARGL